MYVNVLFQGRRRDFDIGAAKYINIGATSDVYLIPWCGVVFDIGAAKCFAIAELFTWILNSNIIPRINSEYDIVFTMTNVIIVWFFSRNQLKM